MLKDRSRADTGGGIPCDPKPSMSSKFRPWVQRFRSHGQAGMSHISRILKRVLVYLSSIYIYVFVDALLAGPGPYPCAFSNQVQNSVLPFGFHYL